MPRRPRFPTTGGWPVLLTLAAALGLLAAIACGPESEETAAPAPSDASGAAAPSGSETTDAAPEPGLAVGHSVGDLAPDVTAETISGESFTLSEVTGAGSPVLLYFFTTW